MPVWIGLGATARSRPQNPDPGGSAGNMAPSLAGIDSLEIEAFVPKLPVVLKSRPEDPDSTLFGEPELVHGPLETRWNGVPAVLVFYSVKVTTVERRSAQGKGPQAAVPISFDRNEYGCVKSYAFVPASKPGKYKPVFIGDIPPNPGDPEIEAVFFANADKDKPKELLVLASSQFNHRALGLAGTNFDVTVFDDLAQARGDSLPELRKVAEQISGKCGSSADEEGQPEVNGCTSAGEVKRHLKRLGY